MKSHYCDDMKNKRHGFQRLPALTILLLSLSTILTRDMECDGHTEPENAIDIVVNCGLDQMTSIH